MIEFMGRLTGNAFKYYKKTMIKTSRIVFLIAFGIAMPIMFFVFNLIGRVDLESILFAASVCLLSAIFLPYPILKFAKGDVTRRIYINDGLVNAVSCEGRTRSAQICAIKKVKDFGDYYAMTLPGICAIVSVYFICEKDLLTNGTIEQFEELFDGKIVRMSDHNQRRN